MSGDISSAPGGAMLGPPARAQFVRRAALSLIIFVTLFLRLPDISRSLWTDEADTRLGAQGTWEELYRIHQYPLYYVLARFALKIEDSEVMLRLPSLIAGVLGVLMMYALAKRFAGPFAGLTAALILATSTIHVQVSQEARFYAVIILLSLVTVWVLTQYVSRDLLAGWIALPILGALGLLTHTIFVTFFGAALLGFSAWVLFSKNHRQSRTRTRTLIRVAICGALALLPVLSYSASFMTLLPGFEGSSAADAGETNVERSHVVSAASGGGGTFRFDVKEYLGYFRSRYFGYEHLVSEICALTLGILGFAHLALRSPCGFAVLASVTFLVPATLSPFEVTHWYSDRYFTYQAGFAILFMALGADAIGRIGALCLRKAFAKLPGKAPIAVYGALIAASLGLLGPGVVSALRTTNNVPYPDWKSAAKYMASRVRPHQKIVFVYNSVHGPSTNYREGTLFYYLERFDPSATAVLSTLEYFTANVPEDVERVLKQFPTSTVWVVSRAELALPESIRDGLDRACGPAKLFEAVGVRVAGEPTVNLIQGGDFEVQPEGNPAWNFRDNAQLVGYPQAFDGEYSARMIGFADGNSAVLFPVAPDPETIVKGTGATSLVPNKTYTVSLDWKFRAISPLSGSQHSAVRVVLAGQDLDAQDTYFCLLATIHGDTTSPSRDWHHCAYTFATGNGIPERCESAMLMLGLTNATGTLWVDNVQFEPGDHATPFVNGMRLPHDQRLAATEHD